MLYEINTNLFVLGRPEPSININACRIPFSVEGFFPFICRALYVRPFTRITMIRETDLKAIDLCAMKNDQLHQHNSINEQFLFSDIKTETYVLRVSEQRVARANDV